MLQNRGRSWEGDAALPLYYPSIWEKTAGVWCCRAAPGLYCPGIFFHEAKCHHHPLQDRGVFLSPPEHHSSSVSPARQAPSKGTFCGVEEASGVRWLFCRMRL